MLSNQKPESLFLLPPHRSALPVAGWSLPVLPVRTLCLPEQNDCWRTESVLIFCGELREGLWRKKVVGTLPVAREQEKTGFQHRACKPQTAETRFNASKSNFLESPDQTGRRLRHVRQSRSAQAQYAESGYLEAGSGKYQAAIFRAYRQKAVQADVHACAVKKCRLGFTGSKAKIVDDVQDRIDSRRLTGRKRMAPPPSNP